MTPPAPTLYRRWTITPPAPGFSEWRANLGAAWVMAASYAECVNKINAREPQE